MAFEWDEAKAEANLVRHGIDFADAAPVLTDDTAVTIPDEGEEGEERFVTVGSDALGRVLAGAGRSDSARSHPLGFSSEGWPSSRTRAFTYGTR